MAKKIIPQFLLLIALIVGSWFLLSKVNWIKLFKVKETAKYTEQKLGNMLWDLIKKQDKVVDDSLINNTIDEAITSLCKANDMDRDDIKLHIVNKDEVNAFAMPGGHLVVYTGIIKEVNNADELLGVLCHEIAHIKLAHVSKKLATEIGITTITAIVGSGSGGKTLHQILKTISSSAFDKKLEKEADLAAVDYLLTAKINPEPFANFMYKMASTEGEAAQYLSWISSHPPSEERATYIAQKIGTQKRKYKSLIEQEIWTKIVAAISTEE